MNEKATAEGLHQVKASWSPYARLPQSWRSRLRKWWDRLGLNRDVASRLRYEGDMMLLRSRCALSRSYSLEINRLAGRRHLRLHLGCGQALLPGWINMDCYPPTPVQGTEILMLDMRRRWPLADGSASALFSEHFLEHLPFETVRGHVLREIYRVLEPEGQVRIGVPDGEYFVEQYVASKRGAAEALYEQACQGKSPMVMLNEIAHGHGHYFVYDFETMRQILEEAGFTGVRRMSPGSTDAEVFKGMDRKDPWRRAMTLYVEAVRP
ncbi:MAG: methyltransferase domain-containing protein [Nitrospirae bacterium]|nr:methyltransferase domain-containing protein [Nitrospirota bacterium]